MLYEINDQQKELIQVALDAYVNSDGPRHFQTDIDVARATLDKPYKPPVSVPRLTTISDSDLQRLVERIEQSFERWAGAVETTFLNGESIEDDLRGNIDYEEEYSELLNDLFSLNHFYRLLTNRVEAITKDYNRIVDWKRDVSNDVTLDGYEDWKRDLVDTIIGAL